MNRNLQNSAQNNAANKTDLMIMSIDLGDKTDILRVKDGDDPYEVA